NQIKSPIFFRHNYTGITQTRTSQKKKGFSNNAKTLYLLVPGARIELAQSQGPRDFKSLFPVFPPFPATS
ncbi:MAG: hypothetical protein MUO63_00880, partial [Desulfobulbaceae bacterium]|nr:hypothetical protein [Desulfobulbaceae bacterium]